MVFSEVGDNWQLAYLKLPQCLRLHGIRLLLKDQEDVPGTLMADNILKHIEDSWKVGIGLHAPVYTVWYGSGYGTVKRNDS